MSSPDHDPAVDVPPDSRGGLVLLPVMLGAGWLIYEVTHQPAIAAMAMCLKFGWEDFRTAHWLRRTDPVRGRGLACWWLYLASGLWQVAVIGVAMVLLIVGLDYMFQGQPNGAGLISLLKGAIVTILFGFTFSTLATFVALMHAWRNNVRPWLNPSVHIARRHREWPPLYGHQNRTLIPVISSIVITCFIVLPCCFTLAAMLLRGVVPGRVLRGMTGLTIFFSVFILLPMLIVFLQNLRRRRFFAEHPADCWGTEPLRVDNGAGDERETV